jgi:hypothetical protein
MYKNWIEGAADQGERAKNREALVVKDQAPSFKYTANWRNWASLFCTS